ncbi:COG1470 family protein [Parabacteroides pacaensis]|uniref:COG1470 family protein n=1 Tax=Parabacteroides pacaensis TaxID=2086575 RepID=UPI0018FE3251|nr:NEW3 domain-containing protein [Parabacteroides pacaensis]
MTMHTNYLNLFIAILFLGVCPMNTHAIEGNNSVILYTPYTKISVPPGESITYSVDVINNSDEVKNAIISLSGLPRAWDYELTAGGFTINELSVLPKEKKNFTLKVTVPLKVNKGTYRFSVSADGLAELPLAVTISKQGTYQTDFTTTQPNMQGNSKSTFTFNATLKNQTADQQLYALMAEAPRGWNVIFKANYKQATSAQVEPNASQSISIDVTPPATIAAGTYKIPVHATTSTTSADLELEVVITGSYEIELTTPKGLLSTDITAGESKRIDLVVKNTGSAELKDIELSANKPVEWEVTFEPTKIERLNAGEATQVTAILKASKKALPGDYVTKMTAKTPEVNSTADFRIEVRTSMLWGWLGVLIIIIALGGVFYLFRKYGRR